MSGAYSLGQALRFTSNLEVRLWHNAPAKIANARCILSGPSTSIHNNGVQRGRHGSMCGGEAEGGTEGTARQYVWGEAEGGTEGTTQQSVYPVQCWPRISVRSISVMVQRSFGGRQEGQHILLTYQ